MNKALRHASLKTIGAFLNSEGGTLLIGVEDNGAVYGLENDLHTVGDSADKYVQLLYSLVTEHIGVTYTPFVKVRFEDVGDRAVCVVDVEKAPEPAYLNGHKGKEFYIRAGNTSRALDMDEAVSYIQNNWGA